MDKSDFDMFIIRSGNLFFVGMEAHEEQTKKVPVWSQYKYDAVRTRNIFAARRIARYLGGNVCLFNPVTGDVN